MNWKSIRNKFRSVLSTKNIGASELEEVEFFEFPKENLPKEKSIGKISIGKYQLGQKLHN